MLNPFARPWSITGDVSSESIYEAHLTSIPTNPLALFNLRESPYFQEALQATGRYPLSLFVGREEAAEILLKKIVMSPGGTR